MKQAAVIVNFHSGINHRRKEKLNFEHLQKIFKKYDYVATFYITEYAGHATEIVTTLDNVDLVLSIGGDGTFNEVVNGNMKRKKPLLMALAPYGTTNDVGSMFSLGKNVPKTIEQILAGEVKKIDLCRINERVFVYVAGFGKFLNISYETSREMKKRLGYFAYLLKGVADFFKNHIHLYEVTYEIDGKSYHDFYSLGLVSNANRIAGINHFYKEVKLDDHKFELLFCTIGTKRELLQTLLYLKGKDITKVPGFHFYRTDNLKITFHKRMKKAWSIDGEKYRNSDEVYDIKIIPDVSILLPKRVSKELFINHE